MPSKKVTIAPKPAGRIADDWVNGAATDSFSSQQTTPTSAEPSTGDNDAVPFKRLTIDIPEELHARIKSQCALRRTKMADEIRALLESHFSV